ncbi:MAG: Crp/Fnr family transcriptional regulator [Pyrinomonadaceae bacterium]
MSFGTTIQTNSETEVEYAKSQRLFSYKRPKSADAARTGEKDLDESRTVDTRAAGNLILEALPGDLSRVLGPSLKQVVLTKEQFVYQEGDRLDFVYFPISAVVSEFKILEDGRMVEIAVIGKEGAIGLSSVFSGSHAAPNCTQVSQAGTAIRIDAVAFEKLLTTNEALRTALSRSVDVYIRQISQKAICNMYHSVKERLCTWLLMVQDRCGRSTLNLTHEQIARTLGVYRPSITCIAQELRKSKLITYSRGGISICNRERIEETACSCYLELGPIANRFQGSY